MVYGWVGGGQVLIATVFSAALRRCCVQLSLAATKRLAMYSTQAEPALAGVNGGEPKSGNWDLIDQFELEWRGMVRGASPPTHRASPVPVRGPWDGIFTYSLLLPCTSTHKFHPRIYLHRALAQWLCAGIPKPSQLGAFFLFKRPSRRSSQQQGPPGGPGPSLHSHGPSQSLPCLDCMFRLGAQLQG